MNKAYKIRDYMDYIEHRLEHWADWFLRNSHNNLGYQSTSIIYVLMTVGIIAKSNLPFTLPTDEDAEEIERLIFEMWKQNKNLANSLRIHYLTRGSLRKKANHMNMSHMHFKNHVDMARQWLAGRLSTPIP